MQSSLVAGRIRRLAEEKKLPVIACVEDAAASGGYWIACAADEIVADPSSILGSIGVIASGFGFQGALERFGVERRLRTAGTEKSFWDPFRPETPGGCGAAGDPAGGLARRIPRLGHRPPRREAEGAARGRSSPAASGPAAARWNWAWRTGWAMRRGRRSGASATRCG